jgi:hypothetical protein
MSGKYMFIFYNGHSEKFSPEESQKQMQKWFDWIGKLQKQGSYLSGDPLNKDGKLLSQKNGKVIVDGPFAESKEVVGGYLIINAENLDAAVEISKDFPDFGIGGKVEVREVLNMDMQPK